MPQNIRTRWYQAMEDWRECVNGTVPPAVAIDTETTGFEWADDAFCATIAWEDLLGRISGHYIPLDFPEGLDTLRELLLEATSVGAMLVFHNAGFDLKKLIKAGVLTRDEVEATMFIDTQCLSIYLDNLFPLKLKGTGPNNLVAKFLNRDQTDEFERLKLEKHRRHLKKDDGYHMLPASVVVPYSIRDATDTYRVWRAARTMGEQKFAAWKRMIDREMEVTLALLDMETAGLGVDREYLRQQQTIIGTRLMNAEDKVREMANQITGRTDWTPPSAKRKNRPKFEHQLAFDGVEPPKRGRKIERPFNPGSADQLAEVLMALGYTLERTSKGAWQVDKKAIERCERHHKHPFLSAVTEFRRLAKIYGTYITGILSEQEDGVLHPSFRQYGARTGRFSSGKETNE